MNIRIYSLTIRHLLFFILFLFCTTTYAKWPYKIHDSFIHTLLISTLCKQESNVEMCKSCHKNISDSNCISHVKLSLEENANYPTEFNKENTPLSLLENNLDLAKQSTIIDFTCFPCRIRKNDSGKSRCSECSLDLSPPYEKTVEQKIIEVSMKKITENYFGAMTIQHEGKALCESEINLLSCINKDRLEKGKFDPIIYEREGNRASFFLYFHRPNKHFIMSFLIEKTKKQVIKILTGEYCSSCFDIPYDEFRQVYKDSNFCPENIKELFDDLQSH